MPANSIVKKAIYNGVEYNLLDSLKSTGTQWIDTGMKLRGDYKILVDCMIEYLGGGYTNPIFGAKEELSAGKSMECQFHIKTTTSTTMGEVEMWSYYKDTEYPNIPTNLLFWYTRKWRICIDGSNDEEGDTGHVKYVLSPNTPTYPAVVFPKSDFETSGNGYLFACNNGTAETSGNGELTIYDYKVYNKTGNLIQHLIPAKRISDGILGMIDLCNNYNFLTNAGTGTFVEGNSIIAKQIRFTPTIQDNIALYEELETLENHINPFPTTLQEVDAQPYIDIDLCPNRKFSWEISYEVDDIRGSSKVNGNTLFHTSNVGWTAGGFGFYSYQGTGGTWYCDFGTDEKSITGGYSMLGELNHKYRVQYNRWEHDGTTELHTECLHRDDDTADYAKNTKFEQFETRRSIWLFRAELATKTSTATGNCYAFSGKFYYCKFWKDIDGVDTLIADLRPVKRLLDGEIGIYDYVRHRFFGPSNVVWQSSVSPSEQIKHFTGASKATPTYIMGTGKVYPNNERVSKLTNKITNKIITLP